MIGLEFRPTPGIRSQYIEKEGDMEQTLEVVGAERGPVKDGQYGPMAAIKLVLKLPDGEMKSAEWFTKATTPVPQAGEKVTGTLEDSQYGLKFRKAKVNGAFGPRPEDPKRSASIRRQHSQHMALLYAQVKATLGQLPDDFKPETHLRAIIDWFDEDVDYGVDRAT